MVEQIKQILLDNWSDLGLIAVGTVALIVYKLQKRDQMKSAATLLKSQIDLIEDVVKELKSFDEVNNRRVYQTRVILSKNYWEESRFLLIKKLGADHVELLEEFYSQAEQLEKSRAAICHELVAAWEHKDMVLQEKLYQLHGITNAEEAVEFHKNIQNYIKDDNLFNPGVPTDLFKQYIKNFRFLSGTSAYDKLSKISYYRG